MALEVNVQRLKELRKEHALSMRELGKRSGVSKDTIWRLENEKNPTAYSVTIRKLAEALGVTPLELQK